MNLQQKHIDALDKAETLMFHSDFCPYLELKEMFPDASPLARHRFRILFTSYYGINAGGLTDVFKDRFFAILFDGNVIVNGQPDFPTILNELSLIPRKKGDYAMPYSFVSKLVGIHQESSPIYDKHVLAFFGKKAPAASVPKQNRIAWYVGFLSQVATDYATWAQDVRVIPNLHRLKLRDQRLAQCHAIRLLDFLIWKVGNQKLL
jgi:hypothetical protein